MTDDRERAPEKILLPPLQLHADVWKEIGELREKYQAWWPGDLKPSQKEVIEMAISELHQREKMAGVGELNRNQQRLVQKTDEPGTNHTAHVWVLVCERPSDKHAGVCCHQYGANGTDFHLRKCPECQGGKTGLEIPLPDRRKVN